MNHRLLLVFVLLVYSCSVFDNPTNEIKNEITQILFPNPPIEIETNEGAGMQYINYFNILKLAEDKYYMYYTAFEYGVDLSPGWNQNVYFAYSTDGFHYIHKSPTGGGNLIMKNVVEQMAFYIPGQEKPFRLIGNVKIPSPTSWWKDRFLYMWESKDGFTFDDPKLLLDDDEMHDTQNVMLVYDDYLKLYARTWKWDEYNGVYQRVGRKLSVCTFDLNGNKTSDLQVLQPDYVYTSAATLYNGREILFPTYFNEIMGGDDGCYVMNFVINGTECQELPCEFNRWIEEDEKWVLISPGIITIGEKDYLGYMTKSKSHDNKIGDIVTRYKLIEVVIQ